MRQALRFTLIWLVLVMSFIPTLAASAPDEDDSLDYPNDRVARITVVRGDVQISRINSSEWEEATTNLPLVEGDRLATGQNSQVEVQFDRDNYLRLAEDSILKIVTLNDNGVAISLPEGVLSVRLGNFKDKRDSFEIDAPNTTIAAEREGSYRVDAPQGSRSNEIKIAVSNGGQARVYSENSGYTIRSGRAAHLFLSGEYAGDIDSTSEISRDYFDDWVATREDAVARSRRDEYRSYYDSNVYGADELNDYGEWIDSAPYGRVWRPHRTSTASHDNWTPYRYGHWRYIPRHGWTWISDEPWGWATSHYGRWVYLDHGWSWCPYEDKIRRRSRWQAALVVFVNIGRNICWYPLPYGHHHSHNRRSRKIVINTTIINNTTIVNRNPRNHSNRGVDSPKERWIYKNAISKMPIDNFGRVRKGITPATEIDAKQAVDSLKENGEIKFDLPVYRENSDARIVKERRIVENRRTLREAERELETNSNKIGAMRRVKGSTLNEKLREERIFKGRAPDVVRDDSNKIGEDITRQPRTGVFDRQSRRRKQRSDNDNHEKPRDAASDRPIVRQPKSDITNSDDNNDRNARPRVKIDRNDNENVIERSRPRGEKPRNNDNDNNRRQPASEPPRQQEPEQRREEAERRRESRPEPPRREESRPEPPKQPDEQRRPEPPKQRDQPKGETSPPARSKIFKKDPID